MEIDRAFLEKELEKMTAQRNQAHDVAVACQAGIDILSQLIARLDLPEEVKFSDLGLPDPDGPAPEPQRTN